MAHHSLVLTVNHRQNQPRRVRSAVVNRLLSNDKSGVPILVGGGVVVTVIVREIAARDIETDAVAGPELIRSRAQVDAAR